MTQTQVYKLTRQPNGVMKSSLEIWDHFPDDDVIPFYAENGTPFVAERGFVRERRA